MLREFVPGPLKGFSTQPLRYAVAIQRTTDSSAQTVSPALTLSPTLTLGMLAGGR
jgi:hypothetical protein